MSYIDTFYDREPDYYCEVGDSSCHVTSYDKGVQDGANFVWTFICVVVFLVFYFKEKNKEKK